MTTAFLFAALFALLFLGVPIASGKHVFGNLYLADKTGAEEFGDEDEVIAVICLDSLRPYHFTDEHKRQQVRALATAALLAPDTTIDAVIGAVHDRL